MKTRFSTLDLICSLTDLQKHVGLRVNQVYDIDQKTYLIKLQKTDEKVVILLESGIRIHSTDYDWPKNVAPSGFCMKMRKHLKNKRLEHIKQLGMDRVIDIQFGSGEAAHHLFVQLFERGNIILTDWELTILNILRQAISKETNRSVREKFPVDIVRTLDSPTEEFLKSIFDKAKAGDNLKKILNPHLNYGPAVLEHALLGCGLQGSFKLGKDFILERDFSKLTNALTDAEKIMADAAQKPMKGYIVQKVEKRPNPDGSVEDFLVNEEFHPYLFRQHASRPYLEFETFDKAVDTFFSQLESQNIDMKAINVEKAAMKKLENVRKDHDQRLKQLESTQKMDREKAELITKNKFLVDQAIQAIRLALANQMSWPDIENYVKEAAENGEPVASIIKGLKLDINHITLALSDPYSDEDNEDDEDDEDDECLRKNKNKQPVTVEIDLDLSAFANARKYYDKIRSAAKKQQKTIESHGKAMKSAEKNTKRALKEMNTIVNINKARKVFWFEKFFWFISSENYLVIAGRDMMQNELIVKRYMKQGDIYVHAGIQGGSSVIIKNPTGEPVPPKTLNEAGIMALAYSAAWKFKVMTTAWWVKSDQVSKTAPSGEYVSTGGFIIRGKKNYLPPGNMIMGYSFLFKLEENSMIRHKDERKVKTLEEEMEFFRATDEKEADEVELVISDGDEDEEPGENTENTLENIEEQDEDEKIVQNDEVDEGEDNQDPDDNDKNEVSFPDTEIKIHHTNRQISLETKSGIPKAEEEEEMVVYLGDDKPVIVKLNQKEKQKKPKNQKPEPRPQKTNEAPAKKEEIKKVDNRMKRGQKAKLKKIKEKYKDQDEEDRQLALEILHNVVSRKNRRDKKKDNSADGGDKKDPLKKTKSEGRPQQPRERKEDDDMVEQAEVAVNVEVDIVNSLTGIPHSEDELLFAIPVVAPYISLQNYKFKVKLTPGTVKRGKAAKTARELFFRDKTCSPREKDLMKGVKDEDLSRNLPGQVKVSGPNLYKK